MSTNTTAQPRQPRGVPVGGQWRPQARPEADIALDIPPDEGPRPYTGARSRNAAHGGGTLAMDDALRSQVTLAAVAAVTAEGPSEAPWEERVAASAMRIAALLSDQSIVSKALAGLERCEKPFVAVPVDGKLEESSNRRVITFETTDRETGEKKTETLRTERMDNPLGRMVYAQARACKGRPALVYKEVEDTGKVKDGHPVKVRVLRWVQPV